MQTLPMVGANARLFINVGPIRRPDWRPHPVVDWPAAGRRNRPANRATPRKQREQANRDRRAESAALQAPLPMAEQQRRAQANREAHQRRYPHPPKLDPLSQVRGDPRLRDEPAPLRVPVRDLTFADLLARFEVDTYGRRHQKQPKPAKKAA